MRNKAQTRVTLMLTVEVAAYIVLAILGAVAGFASIEPIMVVGVVALLVAFAVCTPLRDGVAGRVIAGIVGLAAILSSMKALIGPLLFPEAARCSGCDAASAAQYVLETWLACVGGLLVALVIAAFIRQMARAERSHLIRGLSHTVLDGIAMVAGTGWCFLPKLFGGKVSPVGGWPWIVALVVMLAIAVAFGVASSHWLNEVDPDEHAICPWIGVALMPVMLAGAFVPVLSLVLTLI